MHEQHPFLAHHFDTPKHQFESGKLGIWLFLVTEVLFFAGLFCAYAIYRATHPEIFYWAHFYLDTQLGAINTGVLIVSSLTAAWAVRNAQLGQQKALVINIAITILCAFTFMGIKYVEYSHKFHDGLLWGGRPSLDGTPPKFKFDPQVPVWETEAFKKKHPEAAAAAHRLSAGKDDAAAGVAKPAAGVTGPAVAAPGSVASTASGASDALAATSATAAPVTPGPADAAPALATAATPATEASAAPLASAAASAATAGAGLDVTTATPPSPAVSAITSDDTKPREGTAAAESPAIDKALGRTAQAKKAADKTKSASQKKAELVAANTPEGVSSPATVSSEAAAALEAQAPPPSLSAGAEATPAPSAAATGSGAPGDAAPATPAAAAPTTGAAKQEAGSTLADLTEKEALPLIRAGVLGKAATDATQPSAPKNAHVFFGIYFFMTGLHGIHVLAGIIVWVWILVRALRGQFGKDFFGPVDFAALYWHLVDLVWIYLFPLLYLIH
jgi:cytochrome c oxidase subunit 3